MKIKETLQSGFKQILTQKLMLLTPDLEDIVVINNDQPKIVNKYFISSIEELAATFNKTDSFISQTKALYQNSEFSRFKAIDLLSLLEIIFEQKN